jgi:co-chaperonin GroES (HSP10)
MTRNNFWIIEDAWNCHVVALGRGKRDPNSPKKVLWVKSADSISCQREVSSMMKTNAMLCAIVTGHAAVVAVSREREKEKKTWYTVSPEFHHHITLALCSSKES